MVKECTRSKEGEGITSAEDEPVVSVEQERASEMRVDR